MCKRLLKSGLRNGYGLLAAGSIVFAHATLCQGQTSSHTTRQRPARPETGDAYCWSGVQGRSAFTPSGETAIDPHAVQILQKMVAAYARLPFLDQRTEFTSLVIPIKSSATALPSTSATPSPVPNAKAENSISRNTPESGESNAPDAEQDAGKKEQTPKEQKLPHSVHLEMLRPNRLRMEFRELDPETNTARINQWVSDGKIFWTYMDAKKWYTRDKAPPTLHDFPKLTQFNTGSLELLMLIGVDPFANIHDQVDTMHYLGTDTVRDVPVEVIALETRSPVETTEARFYISQEDMLLRRVVIETTPVMVAPPPETGKDPLDVLQNSKPVVKPAPTPPVSQSENDIIVPKKTTGPVITRITYDNILERQAPPGLDFLFTIPAGSLLYAPIPTAGAANRSSHPPRLRDIIRSMKAHKVKKPRVIGE